MAIQTGTLSSGMSSSIMLRSSCQVACVVLILAVISVLSPVEGLRCYRCDHNEVSSRNNFLLSFVLQQLSRVDHPECKMMGRRDRYEVDIVECPPASDWGERYVCGSIRGTVMATIDDLQVQFDTLVRDCLLVPAGESSYENKCMETAIMDGPTQYLVEEALRAAGELDVSADLHFRGKTCYDTMGVPVESHQKLCPTCTYNELLAVDSLLGPLVELLQADNVEACRLQNAEDKYHVAYRICRPGYQGEINKCGFVEGTVHAKMLSGVGGGIDFRYNSVSRGCAQVDMGGRQRLRFRDGCHTELPFSTPVRKILVQGFKGADVGDLKFSGKVCYNNETFMVDGKPTPPPPTPEHVPHVISGCRPCFSSVISLPVWLLVVPLFSLLIH